CANRDLHSFPTRRSSDLQSNSSQAVLGQWEATSCVMTKKQTVLRNRPYIATFFLFLLVALVACTKGKEEPSVSVPADCQQFLDRDRKSTRLNSSHVAISY